MKVLTRKYKSQHKRYLKILAGSDTRFLGSDLELEFYMTVGLAITRAKLRQLARIHRN